jgi:perosamine synthetase
VGKHEKLALHGGEPVKKTPFGRGTKHSLAEWQAIKPLFTRGAIEMTRGPEVMQLRERFKKLFGKKYAVTASSGTAAIHTAMGALGIGRGDEVITSPITDMGTLTAIMMQNAVPIFADVDPRTLMITPETVSAKITPRTKCILAVHLAGLASDVKGMLRIAKPKGIPVVEDVAQSYLATQGRSAVGTMGVIGCWSLNESKHIGAGDGGVMLTNDEELARRGDLFADKCYNREGGPTDPFFAAYNYRLSTLTAAVCLEQLKKLKWLCRRRNAYGTRLDRALSRIEGVSVRPVRRGDYATYWYYVLHIDPAVLGCTNAEFAKAVSAEGVGMRACTDNVLDWALFREHRENRHACGDSCPLYKGPKADYDIAHFPGLLQVKGRSIRMGMSEYWTPQDISDIIRAVKKVAAWFRAQKM